MSCKCASTLGTIVLKHAFKTAHFHVETDHRVAPRHGTFLIEHTFAIFWSPNCYERTTALMGNTYSAQRRSS